ncbi:glycosyltransferase family 2 protein [Siphonobacter sp. BAB-5385]|uniref:glycosyltransferase family 2 protein n=1 Tax=Siphonobacter sp. BAB-5385 TaxID=1864822 RepID=UPI001C3E6B2A|nr:glycosyltransferase family 2 protein [Siphonobacter sp. BAB-5385]
MNPEEIYLSVIVPCFNEEEVIGETYRRLTQVVQSQGWRYELVFINDGSRDKTLTLLKQLAVQDPRVRVLSFSRNFGHQPAVSAGIRYCSGTIAIIIDADLQDPPELFPAMVDLYQKEQANVVYAVRKERKGESFFKLWSARTFYRLINSLSEVPLPLDTGDFRLIDAKVIREFKKLQERNKYIRGLISWMGFKQVPIEYSREERFAGATKYPLSKMLKFAQTGLLYFSKKPLTVALSLGFISILVGLGLAVWVFASSVLRPQSLVPGWASTVIMVIFFGGIQLLTIGVLGEYIGSIFDELKKRPEFIVSESINFDEDVQ